MIKQYNIISEGDFLVLRVSNSHRAWALLEYCAAKLVQAELKAMLAWPLTRRSLIYPTAAFRRELKSHPARALGAVPYCAVSTAFIFSNIVCLTHFARYFFFNCPKESWTLLVHCSFCILHSALINPLSTLVQHKQDECYSHHVEQEVMILDKACPFHHGEST